MAMSSLFSQSAARKVMYPRMGSIHNRQRSGKAQLITGIRNLEDALQCPSCPGIPSTSLPLFEVLGKIPHAPNRSLSRDESMSLTTNLGWPSSTYFIEGTAPAHPMPMGLAVEVTIYDSEGTAQESSSSEDE